MQSYLKLAWAIWWPDIYPVDCYLSLPLQLPSFPDTAKVTLGVPMLRCLYNYALLCWQQMHLCLHWSRQSHPVYFLPRNSLFSDPTLSIKPGHCKSSKRWPFRLFLAHSRQWHKDPGAPFLIHRPPRAGSGSSCSQGFKCWMQKKSTAVSENALRCKRKWQLPFVKKLGYTGICKVTCREPHIFIKASDMQEKYTYLYMCAYILHCFSIYRRLKDATFVESIHAKFSFDLLYPNLSSLPSNFYCLGHFCSILFLF